MGYSTCALYIMWFSLDICYVIENERF